MAQTPPKTDSGYVFEVLKNKAVSFRRTDMQTPRAREALLTLLGMLFCVEMTDHEVHYILAHAPPEWRYIAVKLLPVHASGKRATLYVSQAEREPGKKAGENAVITNIESWTLH